MLRVLLLASVGAHVWLDLAAGHAAESALLEAGPVKPAGAWLIRALDRLDVEHHWLRGHEHVAWRTGLPLLAEHGRQLTPLARDETHCSAFAAAAAESLGVYLLHPPEHSHVLLANAQYDWLPSAAGRAAGWRRVIGAGPAQAAANRGELVLAVFKNADATRAGHIAVVRPAERTAAQLRAEGPAITQAGHANYRSASLAQGFHHHPGAWQPNDAGGVRYFAHKITGGALAGE